MVSPWDIITNTEREVTEKFVNYLQYLNKRWRFFPKLHVS